MCKLDLDRLKYLLKYDKNTGLFTFRRKRGSKAKGSIAGGITASGHIRMRVDGKKYLAHRLAWFYTYGYMPDIIDHINRVPADNRICNLRDVDAAINTRNCSIRKDNTSGNTGVSWNTKTNLWYAYINIDRKRVHLGFHVEFSDALNARRNAEILYGFTNE